MNDETEQAQPLLVRETDVFCTITIPQGWQPSTTNGENNWEDGEYHIAYQPGRTNIFLGVIPGE